MYGLFEAEFGVQMIRAEEKIRAVAADEPRPALLGVAAGRAAAAAWSGARYTYADRPVELRRGLYRTDSAPLSQRAQLTTSGAPCPSFE